MANVNLTIDADGAAAVRALVKMAQSQDKVERSTKKAGKSAREQARATSAAGKAMAGAERKFSSFMKTALGMVGVAVVLRGVATAVLEVDESLANLARKQADIGTLATSLSALNPGQGEASVNRAIVAGAKHGIGPSDSISAVQIMQSIPENKGKLASALLDAEEVFKLMNLGVTTDEAIASVKFTRRAGQPAGRAGASLLSAADASSFGPTQLAAAGGALEKYSDPAIGFAFASGITSVLADPGKLRTFTERAGTALNLDNPFTEKLSRSLRADALRSSGKGRVAIAQALGLDNTKDLNELLQGAPEGISQRFGSDFEALNEVEKLALIREVFPGTRSSVGAERTVALQRAGLTEKREATAIGALTSDSDYAALETRLATARAAPDTLAGDRVAEEIETNRLFRQTQNRNKALALMQADQLSSERAEAAGLGRLEAGVEMQMREAMPELFVNQESAEANKKGRVAKYLADRGGAVGMGFSLVGALTTAQAPPFAIGPEAGLPERQRALSELTDTGLRQLGLKLGVPEGELPAGAAPGTVQALERGEGRGLLSRALVGDDDARLATGLLKDILAVLTRFVTSAGEASGAETVFAPAAMERQVHALEENTAALKEAGGLGGGPLSVATPMANESE